MPHSSAIKELIHSPETQSNSACVCVCLHEWSARLRAAHVPLPAAIISLTQLPRSASTDAPLLLTFSSWPKSTVWVSALICWLSPCRFYFLLFLLFFHLGLFALLAVSFHKMNPLWLLYPFLLRLEPHQPGGHSSTLADQMFHNE